MYRFSTSLWKQNLYKQLVGIEKNVLIKFVYKLLKLLYELKQAFRHWKAKFDVFMKAKVLLVSMHDPCLYMKKVKNGNFNLRIIRLKLWLF